LKILLYEYVSGGGLATEALPSGLLCEGYAMLRSLTEDFKAAGHEITVQLDARIAQYNPPLKADKILQVSSPDGFEQALEKAIGSIEAVYVIAPESNGTLQFLVERVEDSGLLSLNSPSVAVARAADKAAVIERAKGLGLFFPKTLMINASDSVAVATEAVVCNVGFPAVIKPLSGAGCSGLNIVRDETEAEEAILQITEGQSSDGIIAQELIEGTPASVSLLCNGKTAEPVSLNLQDITLTPPDGISTYNGGFVPLEHPLKKEAFDAAKSLAESFDCLKGYICVDLVLGNEKVFIAEINPRLTTSYIGLRKVINLNVAQALIEASENQLIPDIELKGVSFFAKVPISRPIIFAWEKFCKMEALISPPFPLYGEEISYGLIQSCGNTMDDAMRRMQDVKVQLQQIWEKGQHPW